MLKQSQFLKIINVRKIPSNFYNDLELNILMIVKKQKNPWPTEKSMAQIYQLNLWGSNNTAFYSGFGSHNLEIITPYLNEVQLFLSSFDNSLIVCDLGCGDFNVGSKLYKYSKKYIAIDIVEDLIIYNKTKFNANNLHFKYLDIANDILPKADCVIVRQVLQHLSNAEIQKIIPKLKNYKYIIITEHIPFGNFIANKDIISGQGIRIKKQSGLDILKPPFNFKIKSKEKITSFELQNNNGIIETTIFTV